MIPAGAMIGTVDSRMVRLVPSASRTTTTCRRFMPPAATCQTRCVSHSNVAPPQQFPVEHLAAPVAPESGSPAPTPPVEQAPAATEPANPETPPAATPETPAPANPEQQYNKDPEPSNSQSDSVPADFHLQGWCERTAALNRTLGLFYSSWCSTPLNCRAIRQRTCPRNSFLQVCFWIS